MKRFSLLVILLGLMLSGCAAPLNQAEPTASPAATQTPAAVVTATEAAPTDQPAQAAESTDQPQADAGGTAHFSMVSEESRITYEVGETFIREGNVYNLAVGTTQGVSGEFIVNFDDPAQSGVGPLTVDIQSLTSDSDRRDNTIRDRFLESARYPIVTFTPTGIDGVPETIEPGVEYTFTLVGDMTIRETTRPATFEVRGKLESGTITGQARTTFLMSDYGFGPIDMFGILKTEDEVRVTVDFVARS
jgi:polyisoprenoid-binding protein YceI